jgi:hypothetical protein
MRRCAVWLVSACCPWSSRGMRIAKMHPTWDAPSIYLFSLSQSASDNQSEVGMTDGPEERFDSN